MKINVEEKISKIFACIIIGIVFGFTIIRLFYGAELSDEAYTVAETYMVSRGALPFVNNWSQMPGYTLLLAPFVKIYTMIVGGTDGIVLFFRFLSFFINVTTAFTVCYLLKKYIKNISLLILCSLIYIGASGWDYVYPFRGDNLSVDLLAIGALLLAIFFSSETDKKHFLFISGFLLALSVLCYPTLAVKYLYFFISICFLCYKRKMTLKPLKLFIGGSALAASAVIIYLAVNSGIVDIISGIRYLLSDVTYFKLGNAGIAKLPEYIKEMIKYVIHLLVFSCVSFLGLTSGIILFFRQNIIKIDGDFYVIRKIYLKRLLLSSLLAGVCLFHLYHIWMFKTDDSINISLVAVTVEALSVPLVYFFINTEKRLCQHLLGFIWFPTYIWVVITGIGTYSSMISRHNLLKNVAYLLGIFVVFAVRDCFFHDKDVIVGNFGETATTIIYKIIITSMPVILMMFMTFSYLFNAYVYVYRDEGIGQLKTTVSEGPYKGMHTTDIRAAGLIELDRVIDAYIGENDYVLAMDNDPFIYLMSKGHICTPSTWDQALYSYGFDQPDLYYDYFKVTESEPTKIIYFNYGRDKIMSIDTEYQFNDFVKKKYERVYENRNLFEWNYCDKDVTCELLIFSRK